MNNHQGVDFVYARGGPISSEEREVRDQGWKWVNTNSINATQYDPTKHTIADPTKPDRLETHSHHGSSTHMVVSGDLCIQRRQDDYRVYEISSAPGSERQDRVEPSVKYSATSEEGCTFVEGHKCLSPESAERFISRGTLRMVDRRRRINFPSSDAIRTWLRQVRFNPDGKAHPKWWKGEEAILDTRGARPPMRDDVNTDLLEWFEYEWQKSRPPGRTNSFGIVWQVILIMIGLGIVFTSM
ncbi:hypothetical protein F5Y10DRAFT_269588 [Nemania abortiva]|nr:hypothetical protein F5Y10DRAFT_269588 [Nemania abortiva]